MIYKVTIMTFLILTLISSILMGKTYDTGMMFIAAVVFFGSLFLKRMNIYTFTLQLALLAVFHWFTHLNWCHGIYLIMVASYSANQSKLVRSLGFGIIVTALYTFVRLTYSPSTTYSYLIIGSDILSVVIIVLLFYYISDAKKHKEMLIEEKSRLTTHDSLTNLMNIQCFHEQLGLVIEKKQNIIVLILDCTDLKATNFSEGFQSGNEKLVKVAKGIKACFPHAVLIARYGGDEFAIALTINDNEEASKYQSIVSDELSKQLGISLTYGHALYPEDGQNENTLLSTAEERLNEKKTIQILKREEHMLRAEKLRLVGELAAGMAHEIRNPLTTIKGFLQIAKEKNYNIERWYPLIMDEVTRMSELTSEFLQFSRPHATKFKTQSIQECILRVIQLTSPRALLSGHEILYSINADQIMVHMDRDKIVQVLLNIVQNGLDAMATNGKITITVTHNSKFVSIHIKDTGSGIPESQLEEIFTPFFTTKENGTGLGLPICQKTIQDHGGDITVSSIMNEGTTFSIRLPLSESLDYIASHAGSA